jgi:hypothetical protein
MRKANVAAPSNMPTVMSGWCTNQDPEMMPLTERVSDAKKRGEVDAFLKKVADEGNNIGI